MLVHGIWTIWHIVCWKDEIREQFLGLYVCGRKSREKKADTCELKSASEALSGNQTSSLDIIYCQLDSQPMLVGQDEISFALARGKKEA